MAPTGRTPTGRGQPNISEGTGPLTGDRLALILDALSNPHRMRLIALLEERRVHVSQLAREAGISRPLLYMHLRRLEQAGLVTGKVELSSDGKAMNFFELVPFSIILSPASISEASATLTLDGRPGSGRHADREREDD